MRTKKIAIYLRFGPGYCRRIASQHISTTQRYIDVNDAQLAQAVELI